eukprot:6214560-Pleurochrysis_carterae.AAC.2
MAISQAMCAKSGIFAATTCCIHAYVRAANAYGVLRSPAIVSLHGAFLPHSSRGLLLFEQLQNPVLQIMTCMRAPRASRALRGLRCSSSGISQCPSAGYLRLPLPDTKHRAAVLRPKTRKGE